MDTIAEDGGSLPVFDTLEQVMPGEGRGGSLARVWAAPRAMAAATAASEELVAKSGFVTFSDQRVRDLARCWQVIDGDSDGLLSAAEELPKMIAAAGYEPVPELVESMAQGCPLEWRGSGVDFDTFVTRLEVHACARPLREASLRELAALATFREQARAASGVSGATPAGTGVGMSYQRARGSDFGARFATERRHAGKEAPPVMAGFALRKMLTTQLLSTTGAEQPALTDADVDELFATLQIVTETDRLRLADTVASLSGGLTHMLPESVEATVPHAAIKALFPGTAIASIRPSPPRPQSSRAKPATRAPPPPHGAAMSSTTGSVASSEGSTRGRRRPPPGAAATSTKRLSTF